MFGGNLRTCRKFCAQNRAVRAKSMKIFCQMSIKKIRTFITVGKEWEINTMRGMVNWKNVNSNPMAALSGKQHAIDVLFGKRNTVSKGKRDSFIKRDNSGTSCQ